MERPSGIIRSACLSMGFILAAAVGGCSRSTPVSTGDRLGILQVATSHELADLDPGTNIDVEEDRVLRAIFEGLVRYDENHRLQPATAERWDVSADGLTWIFHLRPDARWSNGAPVTAQDFVYSVRRLLDPHLGCEQASFAYVLAGARAFNDGRTTDPASVGIAAPDAHTLVFRLDHPCCYLLSILATTAFMPVYPPLVDRYDGAHIRGAGWTRAGVLVSNGPFALKAWRQDSVLSVVKNRYYWNAPQVALSEIDFHPAEDAITMEHGFQAKQYHVTTRVPVKIGKEDAAGRRVLYADSMACQFLTFNVARAPFRDARVRRALSIALSRTRLVEATLGPIGAPAFRYARPGIGGYAAAAKDPYDPDLARKLMAQAGYPEGRGFPTVPLMLVGTDPSTLRIGEVIQEAWRTELHVATELAPTEPKIYLDAERTKHYDVILDSWAATWDDPTAVYQTVETGNPNNDSGWSNAGADAAFHDAERSLDPIRRAKDFDRIETLLSEEVPYAPICYLNMGSFVAPSVHGWTREALMAPAWGSLTLSR